MALRSVDLCGGKPPFMVEVNKTELQVILERQPISLTTKNYAFFCFVLYLLLLLLLLFYFFKNNICYMYKDHTGFENCMSKEMIYIGKYIYYWYIFCVFVPDLVQNVSMYAISACFCL